MLLLVLGLIELGTVSFSSLYVRASSFSSDPEITVFFVSRNTGGRCIDLCAG